jgi:hypothetical protein
LVTDYGTLPVPCDRLVQARFGTNELARARRQANDVRAVLHDGSVVTLALEQLDDHELSGASENWGRARIRRDALRELRFGLYQPEPAENEE